MNDFDFSRRDVLKQGGVIALGLVAPPWLAAIAKADVLKVAAGGKVDPDNVLVVCQLSGGNDGLNTVVPYANKKYYQLRPTLGIPEAQVLKINEQLGLHPAMKGLHDLYREKKVAIVQGVGYPQPNRSHFKSMEIWQSASPDGKLRYGWIGRYFDGAAARNPLNPVVAIGLSTEKPRALNADVASIPCFASLTDIQSMVGDPDAERMLRQIQGMEAGQNTDTRVVQMANKTALDAMASLRDKLGAFTAKQTYGNDRFGQGFKQIAQLVATSPQTRVIYFSAGGFDTHARQADSHKNLLQGFSDAMLAFQREMEALGKDKKVTTLVFSEFGRRSYENASAGTDHGAAAPMMLVGGNVKGGIHGPIPDLDNLIDGDLKFAIDFRQVYATTVENWMGGDSAQVLGQKFQTIDVF
ncbi:MAG TPA: DUF1501 domain-containing protein [Fimbriimonadaceae bacterium]|mgnify:CR=1 FL=1|nr:DUF1501 domain-containing protein [Fimbriimonadaceae bacterium]HRJ97011.1 DUF1501 domain-containing protein [Fimbriimonadaceae bacterium]